MQAAASMPILIHTNPTRGTNNTGGDIDMLVGSGDTGHGGNMTLTSGDTVDARHRRLPDTHGWWKQQHRGWPGRSGEGDRRFCWWHDRLRSGYYECGGLNITVAMYEAVLHGCTADAGTAASSAFLCGTMEVTAAQRTAVLGGCTRNAWVALSR